MVKMTLFRVRFESFLEFFRWASMKCLQEIKERHDFETHLNLKSDLTGSLDRISAMISSGKIKIVSPAEDWNRRRILRF